MDYELKRMEEIILHDLQSTVEPRDGLFEAFRLAIRSEADRVKNNLAQATFRLDSKRELRRYVQLHQQAIIRLQGRLLDYTDVNDLLTNDDNLSLAALCRYLHAFLEDLLTFIAAHYDTYFDQDAWIPENNRMIIVQQIDAAIPVLEAKLADRNVEAALIAHALHPIKSFMVLSDEATYRNVQYMRDLYQDIRHLAEHETGDVALALQMLLLQYNVNSPHYRDYCVAQIEQYIAAVDSDMDKLERLAYVQKLIHQNIVKPRYAFYPEIPSLKIQLTEWIDQEVAYINIRQHALPPVNDMAGERAGSVPVRTELSVAQLVYLLRVLVEMNVLQPPTVAWLLRVISDVMQSKRTETISHTSLHGRYYKPESAAKKYVRDLVLRMAKHIEQDELLG